MDTGGSHQEHYTRPFKGPCFIRRKSDPVIFLAERFLLLAQFRLFPPNEDPASSMKEGKTRGFP
jgi:hypothetical protein